MHELGIAQGILDVVLEKSAGAPVRRVRVSVGRSHAVVSESLKFSFALAAEETNAKGAAIEIETVAGDALSVDAVLLDTGWLARPQE